MNYRCHQGSEHGAPMMDAVIFAICCVALALMYMTPTIIAFRNPKEDWMDRWIIVAINVMLGWTVIGWIHAMSLATQGDWPNEPGDYDQP